MNRSIRRAHHVVLACGLVLLAHACISGDPGPTVTAHEQAATAAWVPCPPMPKLPNMTPPPGVLPPKLPGASDNKPVGPNLCPNPSAPLPPPTPAQKALGVKQQAYLAAWKAQAPKWQGLSEAEQEKKRADLKEVMLNGGGQP